VSNKKENQTKQGWREETQKVEKRKNKQNDNIDYLNKSLSKTYNFSLITMMEKWSVLVLARINH